MDLIQEAPIRIFTETVDSATYFVQFLDLNQGVIDMNPVWINLRFAIYDPQALQLQK
jgi:hypothetical protein